MESTRENLNIQKWVAGVSVILLAVKFYAYYLTLSVSVLTDALESIVNVAAGFIGLYSLYVAGKPRDADHPYGHGKAEFISAAVEGTMILSAGAIIIYKAIQRVVVYVPLQEVDTGMYLLGGTALVNFLLGLYCFRVGKKNNSLALQASGRHLQTDAVSSVGILTGLLLLFITGYEWIDPVVAIGFAVYTMYVGYRIVRGSVAGIMDEADLQLLGRMVALLDANRRRNWVDLHNLRVIKYGAVLHIDCHLTVPYYLTVNEAHLEIDALAHLVRKEFGESLELFVHSDGCLPFQCHICMKEDCPVRNFPFRERIAWNLSNLSQNKKHNPSS